MKKQYSISFFVAMIAFALLLFMAYDSDYKKIHAEQKKEQAKTEEKKESMLTEGDAKKSEVYYLKELNGFVVVYLSDQKTIFEYTSIPIDNLPNTVEDQIKKGLPIETAESLYSFLEGYSS